MRASINSRIINSYIGLAKPERTLTNVMTAIAAYLFASQLNMDWVSFLALAIGLTLVIASANALNNFIDRDIDSQMARTQKRALPSGEISATASIVYSFAIGLFGFVALSYTNWLTVSIIAVAYVWYVAIYGYAKRHTVYSTLIGTIPGGASIVAGYTTVSNHVYKAAAILFVMMLAWQMVHFYAIAIFRLNDYKAAKIPILPIKYGLKNTKKQMLGFMILFIFALSLLKWEGYTGYLYLIVMLFLSLVWLRKVMLGFAAKDSIAWAKDVFKFSLVVLLGMCVMIAIGPKLP